MPLYEYECDACGHRFEKIRMYSDPPLNECPKCGSTVHKLQSAPAIQFKGTGFYITDYAKKDSGADAKTRDGQAGNSDTSEQSDKGEKKDKGDKSAKSDSSDKGGAKESGKSETSSGTSSGTSTGSGSTPAATPSTGTKDS
jgi:putative FmdB family regulatory protein